MKPPLAIAVTIGLVLLFGFFGWAFYASNQLGVSWTGGSWVLTLVIVGGVLVTGALTGALMWLAFYSSRKGYDEDAAHFDPRDES